MKTVRSPGLVAVGALLAGFTAAHAAPAVKSFRAGAYAMDVTPTNFPVIVNGGFLSQTANRANDPLHVRWLVRDNGRVAVHLDGNSAAEISGSVRSVARAGGKPVLVAADFEGKMAEISVFNRALSIDEIRRHVAVSGVTATGLANQ